MSHVACLFSYYGSRNTYLQQAPLGHRVRHDAHGPLGRSVPGRWVPARQEERGGARLSGLAAEVIRELPSGPQLFRHPPRRGAATPARSSRGTAGCSSGCSAWSSTRRRSTRARMPGCSSSSESAASVARCWRSMAAAPWAPSAPRTSPLTCTGISAGPRSALASV